LSLELTEVLLEHRAGHRETDLRQFSSDRLDRVAALSEGVDPRHQPMDGLTLREGRRSAVGQGVEVVLDPGQLVVGDLGSGVHG
jgi:hypothetical protein